MDNIFNVPISTEEEIKKLIGTQINCIDLTPFTALTGTVIGYIKITDDEELKGEIVQNLVISVDKSYEPSEELEDFMVDELIGITQEELEDLLENMDNNVPIEIDEDSIYLDFSISREFIENKKVIIVPFTHCSTQAF